MGHKYLMYEIQPGDFVTIPWQFFGKNPCGEISLTAAEIAMITGHYVDDSYERTKWTADFWCLTERGRKQTLRLSDIISVITPRDNVRRRVRNT